MLRSLSLRKSIAFLISFFCFISVASAGPARDCIAKANERNLVGQEKRDFFRVCLAENRKSGTDISQSADRASATPNKTRENFASSSAPATTGVRGAPDLLGYQIGVGPLSSIEGRTSQLVREGYRVKRESVNNSIEAVQVISLEKASKVPTSRTYYTTESSYVRLSINSSSQIRAIVRGETFVKMPFIRDFVPILQNKLNAPPWVVSALIERNNTGPTGDGQETTWGVANGKAIRFDECFQQKRYTRLAQQEYRPGGFQTNYWAFLDSSFADLKRNHCQYAVAVHKTHPIYGDDRPDVVASYAVTIIELQNTASEAHAMESRSSANEEKALNQRRATASKPSL